jgi:hypothetical protein
VSVREEGVLRGTILSRLSAVGDPETGAKVVRKRLIEIDLQDSHIS